MMVAACLLPLAAAGGGAKSQWSDQSRISSIEVVSGRPFVAVVVSSSTPVINPAGCDTPETGSGSAYVHVPLDDDLTAESRRELINLVYYALLNHHHVVLEISAGQCSKADRPRPSSRHEGSAPVLLGIRIRPTRHHLPVWPDDFNDAL